MNLPTGPMLYPVLEATWPPASTSRVDPWTIREGRGGGQRVSAATADGSFTVDDIGAAEQAMQDLGQPDLFFIREGDDMLDAALDARGYQIHDPVALYAIRTDRLTDTPWPRVAAFSIWPPLAIMHDLWDTAGISSARRDVMTRANDPKTAILGRQNDLPAGAAFVACHGTIAMIHAIEVVPAQRRQGVGVNILRKAAFWAEDQGADILSLAVTRANDPANFLYSSIGMQVTGYYHYRIRNRPITPPEPS